MNSAGSAICGRCFAVYQEGYGHVCATPQPDWRSLSDDLARALEMCRSGGAFKHPQIVERADAALLRYSQARGDGK